MAPRRSNSEFAGESGLKLWIWWIVGMVSGRASSPLGSRRRTEPPL